MNERLLNLTETQHRLGGIGRTSLFGLLRDGDLRAVRIGRRTMIPESQIDAYIRRKIEPSTFPTE